MNVSCDYSVANNNHYAAGKSSKTNGETFKITQSVNSEFKGTLTYVGYGQFDPFKDMAATGNFELPELMQTLSKTARSDEEILKDIEELAKEEARTGQHDEERFAKLLDEYVSSVSPDREGILKNKVKEIHERLNQGEAYNTSAAFQQIDLQRAREEEIKDEKEPIDYLIEWLKNKGRGSNGLTSGVISSVIKNGSYTTIDVDQGGGMKTTLNYDDSSGELVSMQIQGNNYSVGGIDYNGIVKEARFYDDNGELIAFYNGDKSHGSKLSQVYTKAENARFQEMSGVFNAAYDVARGWHEGSPARSSEEFKEAYNKTYEKLTSVIV